MHSVVDRVVANSQDDGITIYWPDGSEAFFHHFWLRDCCYCEACGDPRTGKRLLLPSDVPLDIKPRRVDLNDDGTLLIVWDADEHASRYAVSWLHEHRYTPTARAERIHRPTTWSSRLSTNLPTVLYEDVSSDELANLDLLRKLRDYGFVIVRDGPREPNAVTILGNLIGDLEEATYGTVVDITPLSEPVTLADTMIAQAPHTDEGFRYSPPGIIVFYCQRPAAHGGDTILVDGFHLGNRLRQDSPAAFELLASQPQSFARSVEKDGIDLRSRATVFVVDEFGEMAGIRFSARSTAPLDVSADKIRVLHAAKRQLSSLFLSDDNQLIIRFAPGDAVLFDNHRVMHGRTAFADPNRFIKQCNVRREQFHERLRATARRLGFTDEANQILSAGAIG